MIPSYRIRFTGFHGTVRKFAENIVRTRRFNHQYREDHWLGQGVYFFKDDYDNALWWAYNAHEKANYSRNRKVFSDENEKVPAVIQCEMEVQSEMYLNLDSPHGREELKKYEEEIFSEEGIELTSKDKPSKEFIRCSVIDSISIEKFKVVQYTFSKGGKSGSIMPELGIGKNSTQVNVRNNSVFDEAIIKIVEIPAEEGYKQRKSTGGEMKMDIRKRKKPKRSTLKLSESYNEK